jgi:iron complex outermembrane receptor protein
MTIRTSILLCSVSAAACMVAAPSQAQNRMFDIPAQAAITAIPEFARQAQLQVVAPARDLNGVRTPTVRGAMETRQALRRLIKGTPLRIATDDGHVITLRAAANRADAETINTSAPEAHAAGEDIVVTGTRIVRDGYQAPTPTTVLGQEEIQRRASTNIADQLGLLPAFAASTNPRNSASNISGGIMGINALNLRGLGQTRTLVLLDGQRLPAGTLSGWVDINTVPNALIKRVDIVTGGASAAWGSDAVAGVVNFVLDKEFTGIKGDAQGGVTTYGDDRNFKVSLSGGTAFADGRGHIIVSVEDAYNQGLKGLPRPWYVGAKQLNNPTYTATNGQPQLLVRQGVGYTTAAPGGIVTAGPLRGVYFGPNGVPGQLNYGSVVSDPFMVGGDWQYTDFGKDPQDLDPKISRQSAFGRLSYDITDSIELFGEFSFARAHTEIEGTPYFSFGGININRDNAFLPAEIATRMTTLGLPSITIGTWNADIGPLKTQSNRKLYRYVIGASGHFGALGSEWNWSITGNRNVSKIYTASIEPIKTNYANAIDAVRNANGTIVCRSSLTNPTNGCVPLNILGTGVASQAALNYVMGNSYLRSTFTQDVVSATMRGEPLSTWAGPISLAFGMEYRREAAHGTADALSLVNGYWAGNFKPIKGSYDVTEGFAEVVVPLVKDASWAKSLDLNAAVRGTDYSSSGYVTTWKVGATFAPIDDIKFRVTRSRDIRAGNLADLYQPGAAATTTLADPFRNNISNTVLQLTTGNPTISPEKADTFNVGAVVQPRFVPGLSASVDYWDINIKDAIASIGASTIVNQCYAGNASLCQYIVRDSAGVMTQVLLHPINLSRQVARGLDFEMSYRLPLSTISSAFGDGRLTIRALATRYLKSMLDNGINIPDSSLGENNGGVPKWLYSVEAAYARGPLSLSLTGRGISDGVLDASLVECSSNCPASTADHRTIESNHVDGAFYLDASIAYKIWKSVEMYVAVDNLTNRAPSVVASSTGIGSAQRGVGIYYYDLIGRSFRGGVRFKF